jgi:hypothetical protein
MPLNPAIAKFAYEFRDIQAEESADKASALKAKVSELLESLVSNLNLVFTPEQQSIFEIRTRIIGENIDEVKAQAYIELPSDRDSTTVAILSHLSNPHLQQQTKINGLNLHALPTLKIIGVPRRFNVSLLQDKCSGIISIDKKTDPSSYLVIFNPRYKAIHVLSDFLLHWHERLTI